MKDVVMVDSYNAVTTTVAVCFIFRVLYAKAVNRKNVFKLNANFHATPSEFHAPSTSLSLFNLN